MIPTTWKPVMSWAILKWHKPSGKILAIKKQNKFQGSYLFTRNTNCIFCQNSFMADWHWLYWYETSKPQNNFQRSFTCKKTHLTLWPSHFPDMAICKSFKAWWTFSLTLNSTAKVILKTSWKSVLLFRYQVICFWITIGCAILLLSHNNGICNNICTILYTIYVSNLLIGRR